MPGRRPLLLSLALLACALPACLHINARVGPEPAAKPITTPEQAAEIAARAKAPTAAPPADPPRTPFAVLPKLPQVPGTSVQTKPDAPVTAHSNPAPKPPDGPPTPPSGVRPAGLEPAAFPLLSGPAVEPPLLAAVRAYAENRPEQAIEIIRRMDRGQQDFVLAVLPILARGATADLANDPSTAAALVDQLRAAASRLEPLAALRIDRVAVCDNVDGFGRFTPRPIANHFRPNERVQLYLEVRNLGSQPAADGFLTHVHAAVELRDAEDKVVAQIDPKDHRRVPVVRYDKQLPSRSPLHDFHVLYSFAAPPAPGVYTVTVQLSDAAGRRTVKSAPTEFRVAGPGQ